MTQTVLEILVLGIYTLLLLRCSRRITVHEISLLDQRVLDLETRYQRRLKEKDKEYQQKIELEEESIRIFALYELTREITQSLKEEEAFQAFRKKLKEHARFEKCFFIEPKSEDVKEYKRRKDHLLLPIKSKRKRIAYLAIKGLNPEDREKVGILTSQFTLAFRRVKLYEEIEKVAITDSLTEVFTRRYTIERLQEEIHRAKNRKIKVSLLMIDVDHFKKLNDQFGHLTGDQVLREVGEVIKENIREIDIAGRYGGEEFSVVLPETDHEGALFAAERIRSAMETTTIKAYDNKVNITVSIGLTTYPADGKEIGKLIDNADQALYRAKERGRNRVCAHRE